MSVANWTKTPVAAVSGWALLTPNPNTVLTTIAQLGSFTVTQLGGITLSQGYTPPSGTSWAKA